MLQQQAFSGTGRFLKGGLHCHTTRSDGRGAPDEVIRLYYQNGYDFLALTDHRFYNYENFAPECPITIIPGMEFDNTFERGKGFRTFHTVCIGPSREDGNGYAQDERFERGTATGQEEYQAYLDDIHAHNNLTIHCHPEWSRTPARFFDKLRGNFAIEVWNSGAALGDEVDMDAYGWDELLGQGQRIWGVATDDGHKMQHHCNGWVMVRAENNINAILEALKEGRFYASTGPEITNFYVENNIAVVECAPVAKIRLHSEKHPTRVTRAADGGGNSASSPITRAEFDLVDWWAGGYEYVRATVVDADGHMAWTNPIFLD